MSNLTVVHDMTKDQLELIKSTVAKNATTDELNLFLYRCKHMGLDPLKPGQIHFVKYGSGAGTIVVGIDGFRSKAAATGKHSGTKRGVIRDDAGRCVGAWAEVYRSDWQHPAREEVSLFEYNKGGGNWAKMPETMIKKVAEVAALRMAFPDDLGGVYSDDEMDQAAPRSVSSAAPAIEPRATNDIGNGIESGAPYVATFGKYKGLTMPEIKPGDLAEYCDYIIATAKADGKEITGKVDEFLRNADAYLETLNN